MSSVIGQGIALLEKWPGIFVVAERGNDFETGAVRGHGRRWNEKERGGICGSLPERASLLDARARGTDERTDISVHTFESAYETLAMQHTCRPVCARSCSL